MADNYYLRRNEIKNKTCDMDRPFAFISYSHDDREIVQKVFSTLYDRGYNLWIDVANIPYDENEWSSAALKALRKPNCRFVFFFRSERSMVSEPISKELYNGSRLKHIDGIVTVDIWQEEGNTAGKFYDQLLNGEQPDDVMNVCDNICDIVKRNNSAFRLAADFQNDVDQLMAELGDVLQKKGVMRTSRPSAVKADKPIPDHERKTLNTRKPVQPEISQGSAHSVISLPDFLKKYDAKTFLKDTYQSLRLAGRGKCEKYSTDFCNSASTMTWSFMQKVLEEQGMSYISRVVEKNKGKKNPPFITEEEHQLRIQRKDAVKYRKLDVAGLEGWSMCSHYGQYGWMNEVLRNRIRDLGCSEKDFDLEYLPGGQEKTDDTVADSTKPEKGNRTRRGALEEGGYNITLYGKRYTGLSLKNMMLTVFTQTMDRHPDKLDELLDVFPCLKRGDQIGKPGNPAVFRGGKTHTVNGTEVSIGSSLGQKGVLDYINRLMRICGEPKENLTIDGYQY